MRKNHLRRFKIDAFVCFLFLSLLLVFLSFLFKGQSLLQTELVIGAVIAYIGFCLVHHYLDKSLTKEIVLEYILVATLITVIMVGVLVK